MQLELFTHTLLSEYYEEDEEFKGVRKQLKEWLVTSMEGNEYHLKDGILYRLDKLCIPHGRRFQLMREEQTSRVVGHFGMTKIVVNLK